MRNHVAILLVLLVSAQCAFAVDELPPRAVRLGPRDPLFPTMNTKMASDVQKDVQAQATPPAMDAEPSGPDATGGNNITITKSRLVMSTLDQVQLLSKLTRTLDLAANAPKLAARLSSTSGKQPTDGLAMPVPAANKEAAIVQSDDMSFREGFLYELCHCRVYNREGHCSTASLVNARPTEVIIRLDSSNCVGFGWRYPLQYWRSGGAALHGSTCAVQIQLGKYFYC